MSPILVPLDGSPSSVAALRTALQLAGPGGEIIVLHVIDRAAIVSECVTPYGGDPMPALEALESDERDVFASASAEAAAAGVACTTVAMDGKPSSCIVASARKRGPALVVMGTHGRHGLARVFVGSTSIGVLHETPTPVLVVHAHGEPQGPLRTILVAIDDSTASSAAVATAIAMMSREGGLIVLAHVVEDGTNEAVAMQALDGARAEVAAAGLAVDSIVLHEEPVDAILASAETAHADAIAVGAHARSGVRFGMGSVAEAIVTRSAIPVLVVPPPAVRTGAAQATQAEALP